MTSRRRTFAGRALRAGSMAPEVRPAMPALPGCRVDKPAASTRSKAGGLSRLSAGGGPGWGSGHRVPFMLSPPWQPGCWAARVRSRYPRDSRLLPASRPPAQSMLDIRGHVGEAKVLSSQPCPLTSCVVWATSLNLSRLRFGTESTDCNPRVTHLQQLIPNSSSHTQVARQDSQYPQPNGGCRWGSKRPPCALQCVRGFLRGWGLEVVKGAIETLSAFKLYFILLDSGF